MLDSNPGAEFGEQLLEQINGLRRRDIDTAAIYITAHGHRTLQQLVMGLFVELITLWARDYDNQNYDPRNEATVNLAKKIMDCTTPEDRALPFI